MNSHLPITMRYQTALKNSSAQLSVDGLTARNLNVLQEGPHPDGVIVCGMGGSGLAGTLLAGLADDVGISVPVVQWKSYGLPTYQFSRPLYVFVSYSGETAEIRSGLRAALDAGAPAAVVTSDTGGVLKTSAEDHGLPLVTFPADKAHGSLTPRQSCGYMYYSVLKLLSISFPNIEPSDLRERVDSAAFEENGRDLAETIGSRAVLVYTTPQYAHLGSLWKVIINETAKRPAFANTFPEMSHNEVIGFTKEARLPFSAVFLADPANAGGPIEKKRLVVEQFLVDRGIPVSTVSLVGVDAEEKTWSGAALAHWTCVTLAEQAGVDPISTDVVSEIKQKTK